MALNYHNADGKVHYNIGLVLALGALALASSAGATGKYENIQRAVSE